MFLQEWLILPFAFSVWIVPTMRRRSTCDLVEELNVWRLVSPGVKPQIQCISLT